MFALRTTAFILLNVCSFHLTDAILQIHQRDRSHRVFFQCSTYLRMKFFWLINLKKKIECNRAEHEIYSPNENLNVNNLRHLNIYQHNKFGPQLSWAWKKIFSKGPGFCLVYCPSFSDCCLVRSTWHLVFIFIYIRISLLSMIL